MKADGDPVLKGAVQGQEVSYRTYALMFTDKVANVLGQFGA